MCLPQSPVSDSARAARHGAAGTIPKRRGDSYDWVTNHSGQKLRTFVTRPTTVTGQGSGHLFCRVAQLRHDGVSGCQYRDGFGIFMRRLIDESGYATVRMDKPGVGESQGDCSKADFDSEMEGWQAAFEWLGKYDFMDPSASLSLGSAMAVGSRRWRRRSIRCAASSPRVHGDAPGTNTCWSWSGHDYVRAQVSRRSERFGKSPYRFLQPVSHQGHDSGAGHRSAS